MAETGNVEFRGKVLGRFNGHRDMGFYQETYFEFKPADDVPIPACSILDIDHEFETWEAYDKDRDTPLANGYFDVAIKVSIKVEG